MASFRDIAPTILSQLPVSDLISLAQTTVCTVSSSSDETWNAKLSRLGYPPVPCAQGFYFLVVTHGAEDHLIAAINGGVMAHINAVMKRQNLKEADIAKALPHVTSEPEGELRQRVIEVMKTTSAADPTKYKNYSPAILALLPEVLTAGQANRFIDSISHHTVSLAPHAVHIAIILARIHHLKPSYVLLNTQTAAQYLLNDPWVFYHDLNIKCDKDLHDTLVELYPELERRAMEDPLTYCAALMYVATQYLIGNDFIEPSLKVFFSTHIKVLLTLPDERFDVVWSMLGWLSVDSQLIPIIEATKATAIREECIVELVMRVASSEYSQEGSNYLWVLDYEDVVLPADKWDEFLSQLLRYITGEDFLASPCRAGIPLAYAEEYIANWSSEEEVAGDQGQRDNWSDLEDQ